MDNHRVETLPEGNRVWLYGVAAVIALFLILPILLIVPMSFSSASLLKFPPPELSLRWYRNFFDSESWTDAARVSLTVAFWTTVVATPTGTLAAYAVHTSDDRIGRIIWIAVMAPLLVPVVLVGIGLYFTFARLGLNNSHVGLVLAHSMHATPYVFLTMFSALQSFDMNQPRVAQSLGAPPWRAFLEITLPQLKLSVCASAFLAFLASFDEVVIALFISGGSVQTLPKLMFTELRSSLDPTITAVSSMMLTLAVLVLAVTQYLGHRQRRAARR